LVTLLWRSMSLTRRVTQHRAKQPDAKDKRWQD
jgi:hypothetical protein